ncbi:MAG: porin [Gammaproteobacteria bacterium]
MLLFASMTLYAEDRQGLLDGLSAINDSSWFKETGLYLNAWADMGIVYNANDPEDRYNGPVVFADRAGEFNLNQLVVQLSRDIDTRGGAWDIGGRVTFMYGSDARFNTINPYGKGHWDNDLLGDSSRFYKIAIPNAYLDIFSPIGNGLTARIGRFYTIMGYETGLSPDNFFFTHPYTFQYGEPFTHMGLTLTYPFTDQFSVVAGAVTGGHNPVHDVLDGNGGWDGFDHHMEFWIFLGGIFCNSKDEATQLALTVITGDVNSDSDLAEFRLNNGFDKRDNRTFYSFVFQHDFTERWHYVLQHDHGIEQQHPLNDFRTAHWYGVQTQTRYDLSETLGIGLRAEWFRDADGVRVGQMCPGCAELASGIASYYTVSAGLNWKPVSWIVFRPEIRYDWSDGLDAYDNRNKDHQLLLGADIVVSF